MIPHVASSGRNGETRRQFIKKSGTVAAAVAGASLFDFQVLAREKNASVSIVLDAEDAVVKQAPVRWAAEQLRDALAARGVAAQLYENLDQASLSQECVLVTGGTSNLARQILKVRGISLSDA